MQPDHTALDEPRVAAAYLAAMIDGEGHVSSVHQADTRQSRYVAISNTDQMIIAAICHCLNVLGITYMVKIANRTPPHKQMIQVFIYGRPHLERLSALVPIQSLKWNRLQYALASYTSSRWFWNRVDHTLLHHLYYVEGHSQREVASLMGFSKRSIQRCMKAKGWRARYGPVPEE